MSLRLSSPSSSGGAGRRQQSLEGNQDVPALVRGPSRRRSIPSRRRATAFEGGRSRPSAGRQRACERRPGRSKIGGPYGGIVELLALTGQRREEVARLQWEELDLAQRVWMLPKSRAKNAKAHVVHLSEQSIAVLTRADQPGPYVFSLLGTKPFQRFSRAKRLLDQLSGVTGWRLHDLRRICVSGIARLGVAPNVADKILNHQAGTISGVAAAYQRHEFLLERKEALERWGAHVAQIVARLSGKSAGKIRRVA